MRSLFQNRSRGGFRFAPLVVALCFAAPRTSVAVPQPAERPRCKTPIPDLYRQVSPAVVSITAISIDASEATNRTERRTGSGVIVDPSGLILTNSHVVYGQPIIEVTLDDQTSLPARIVGIDPFFDIALVRVSQPAAGKLPAAHLGRSEGLLTGDEVFAIGNPFGLEQTFTRGIVSAVNRILPGVSWSTREPMIQTDAAINPGSSGGPLIDRCGEVVGITTAILPDAQGIGFAIPVDVIREEMPELIEKGRVVRPWLGVQGQLVTPDLKELFRIPLVEGLLIEVVEPGSPAAGLNLRGGNLDVVIGGAPILLGGDVITEVDGEPVVDQRSLKDAFEDLEVGATVRLTVFREEKTFVVEAAILERPMPTAGSAARRTMASEKKPGPRPNARFDF